MRGRWGLAVVAAVVAVLLAGWVTATPKISYVRAPSSADPSAAPESATPTPEAEEGEDGAPAAQPVSVAHIPTWVWVVASILLSLIVLALVAFLVGAEFRSRRERAAMRGRATSAVVMDDDVIFDEHADYLAGVAANQREILLTGPPRNAIVACWLALEEAAEAGGLRRAPAETSLEFTQRVVSRHVVSEAAIYRLAALYREARFSEHQLNETHRGAAVAALDELAADLTRSRVAGPPG